MELKSNPNTLSCSNARISATNRSWSTSNTSFRTNKLYSFSSRRRIRSKRLLNVCSMDAIAKFSRVCRHLTEFGRLILRTSISLCSEKLAMIFSRITENQYLIRMTTGHNLTCPGTSQQMLSQRTGQRETLPQSRLSVVKKSARMAKRQKRSSCQWYPSVTPSSPKDTDWF